jgi:lincosamide nucleotidyltransferase
VGRCPLREYVDAVLIQQRLIAGVREVCHTDERLDAALMYGSFASDEADAHSDVEFWLFFLPQWRGRVDPRAWCAQIAPVTHLVRNEFGTDVAFFPGLVRGEFHFATTDDIATVGTWPGRGAATDRMIVLDRSDRLRPALESLSDRPAAPCTGEDAETLCGRFANWLVLAHHVAARGEILRAWDTLGHVHRHLLWMARLAEDSTAHWLTPSRRAEAELPPHVVAELRHTTVSAEPDEVRDALRTAWRHGRAYWTQLAQRHNRAVPRSLFAEIDAIL